MNAVNVQRHRADVVLQQFLVEDAEGREQPHRFEVELVELGQPRVAFAVGRRDRLPLDEELPRLLPVGVAAEVVVHGAGLGDRVERRVDDSPAHPPAHDVVLAPVDLGPLHAPRPELRVEVPRERVECFVIVIVGVERLVGEVAHDVKATRPVSNDSGPPRRGTARGPSNTLAA